MVEQKRVEGVGPLLVASQLHTTQDGKMNPKETIKHIQELAAEAGDHPTWLTFQTIHEWCEKQMDAYNGGLSDEASQQSENDQQANPSGCR